MDTKYDAIVIGAGVGGAACAGLLSKYGMKVLLVEKSSRPGGKTQRFSKDGFTSELWPITANPIHNTRYEEIIRELGLDVQMLDPVPSPMFYYRGPSGKFEPFEAPGPGPVPMTEEEAEGFSKLLADMMSLTPEAMATMEDITVHDFLSRYRLCSSVYSFWAQVCNITFLEPVDLVPASEMFKTMNSIPINGGSGYIKGGFARLAEECVEAVKRNGGIVKFKTAVEKIAIKDGQVRGVVTSQGEYDASILVSNAGIQPTVLKLIGAEHFDKSYINYVKDLVPSFGLMGYRYYLNKPVLDHPLYITFSDEGYWNIERSLKAKADQVLKDGLIHIVIPSVFDPSLTPEGKQLVLASIMSPADPEIKNPQVFWEQLDKTIAEIWPDFHKHIERKETFSIADISAVSRDHVLPGQGGECIGLGQIMGQCGRNKPSERAPVRGLFYVGTDAGGYGCGTHQALESAFNVAHQVLRYYQTH